MWNEAGLAIGDLVEDPAHTLDAHHHEASRVRCRDGRSDGNGSAYTKSLEAERGSAADDHHYDDSDEIESSSMCGKTSGRVSTASTAIAAGAKEEQDSQHESNNSELGVTDQDAADKASKDAGAYEGEVGIACLVV
eukprot:CAMPEP_0181250876 /NCGR_PEP_ID=MMETSP1096-20121128/46557_1 /TAXON_ID=156174 ORGANISM="Chrysochromulina ericina, Strain CCMP281" /NCGR_SAMPLE_ID=MMETSP1096 /ASSEMBLY_ACC=CAM_ASM_000453 /LENGTH=135 /DNA_ID=CAMNT_0023348381 /DNA_START=420 /DNA_END=827 /DNA_ORIENTATION=+